MSEENLWGVLPPLDKIETPISILRIQAALLAKLSEGRLEGRIASSQVQGSTWEHQLKIVVPALEGYSVTIASADHNMFLYPVSLYQRVDKSWESLGEKDTPDELKEGIKEILQSERVRKIVRALLAQVADAQGIATAG